MNRKLLLMAAILAVPSLSFGQTVCTVVSGFSGGPLVAGGSVALLEGNPEVGVLSCPGVTFTGGPSQTFTFTDEAGTHVSDIVTFQNGLGGSATITFTSDVCGTSCVETGGTAADTDAPPAIFVTTTSGMVIKVTSDDDPNTTGNSDLVSASPEPATFATFGTGLLLFGAFLRRRLCT